MMKTLLDEISLCPVRAKGLLVKQFPKSDWKKLTYLHVIHLREHPEIQCECRPLRDGS